jgi:catalase
VTALETTYGVHPGQRRNHTKGFCAEGNFVGLKEAAAYSKSALFSGSSIPVVARFSVPGGDPTVGDADPGPRGMALEFRLPDQHLQHMTMINVPIFFATQPRGFLDFILALKPDSATGKPDPAALQEFAANHPESAAFTKFVGEHNPPPSYANSAYFGIHTFKFIGVDGKTTPVRWRFVPQDGEKQLSAKLMADAPHDFLQAELIRRTREGPVLWDMWITIGEPGDAQDDPTVQWPSGRTSLKVGTLTITSASGSTCDNINYDPLVMADGIAPSNDPVLLFRSPSYKASFEKRIEGK